MADVKFTPNRQGMRAIANSGELGSVCLGAAQAAANQARAAYPGNYRVDVRAGSFRQHAKVKIDVPTDFKERQRFFSARSLSRVHPHI